MTKFQMLLAIILTLLAAQVLRAAVSLKGAGASFPNEVYKTWMPSFAAYRRRFVSLHMTYDSIGSGSGRARIKEAVKHQLAYAGSDSLLSEQDYVEYPDLQMFPVLAGAVVIGFNLPGIASLTLSRHHIVGIYNGTYHWWNDTDIQDLNPNISLPQRQIIPIVRADKSGTTEIFTKALSSFSGDWARHHGHFSKGLDDRDRPVPWDSGVVSTFGQTNRGVSGLLLSIKYSVAYLSIASAKAAFIKYASIQNKAGNVVSPVAESIQAAMDDRLQNFTKRFTVDITDTEDWNSYPIAAYTYFVIQRSGMTDCVSARELYRYLQWILQSKIASDASVNLNFVPLSKGVVDKITQEVLSEFTCRGNLVYKLNEKQIEKEKIADQEWRLPTFIATPICVALLLLLVAFIIWHQVKLNQAIIRNEWKLALDAVQLISQSKQSMFSSKATGLSSLSWKTGGTGARFTSHGWKVGKYCDQIVCLRSLNTTSSTTFRRATKKAMLWWRDSVHHLNINPFYGLVELGDQFYTVNDLCSKGMLRDILQNEKYNLDINFKYSISCDVAAGMKYLHSVGIIHGNLSSGCCWIDSRWTVKIADWQYSRLALLENDKLLSRVPENQEEEGEDSSFKDDDALARTQMWTAVECLKGKPVTKESDVYSFSILLVEIFTREDPYDVSLMMLRPFEVIQQVLNKGLRPPIPSELAFPARKLVEKGWDVDVLVRPSFTRFLKVLEVSRPTRKSVLDCMMESVEEYTEHLEEKVQEKTAELQAAMKQMKDLLHQMLPESVAESLSKGQNVEPESFDNVTIFFSDIVGFTKLSSESTPFEIVRMLNDLYMTFDSVVDSHSVYKVETIGDAYMVISGCPTRNGTEHAQHIAAMAIDFAFAAVKFRIHHRPDRTLQLRAGIHSGPVCAGVVGHKMPRYCLFGDTVNTASRMESTSVAMKIQLSEDTLHLLKPTAGFITVERGYVNVKGKGSMKTYWLHGKYGMDPPMPMMFCRQVIL